METSDRLNAPSALPPEKEPPIPVGYEAGWILEPVWTLWRTPPLFTLIIDKLIDHVVRCSQKFKIVTEFLFTLIPNIVKICSAKKTLPAVLHAH
jgi:hypothetical protein